MVYQKSIENIITKDQNFVPAWINTYQWPDIKFNGHCFISESPDSVKVINLEI